MRKKQFECRDSESIGSVGGDKQCFTGLPVGLRVVQRKMSLRQMFIAWIHGDSSRYWFEEGLENDD